MAISIITDSTAYLSKTLLDQENIEVVPLNIIMQDKQYREGELSNRECYRIMRHQPVFPQTSQPSVGDFLEVYQRLLPGDEALVILISSCLSGTCHSAVMAQGLLNRSDVSIHVVDSLSTSIGLALQIEQACEMRQAGSSMEAILGEMKRIIPKTNVFFIVDDLEYLSRGGRIGPAAKYIGNALQIKPILYLQEGRIEVFDKIRTKHKAVTRIVDAFSRLSPQVEKLAVTHVDAPEEAEELRLRLSQIYSGPICVRETGPVIGAHVGPGTVGLAYF
ncbi:MAG: DegV family protein [Syntrophomonadaceae bacterium]